MLLTATDPLPLRPRRVLVNGTSGAGKTTLARRLAARMGCGHVEIDALFHGPGWVPRPGFVEEVDAFSAEPSWVTEYQYSAVRPLLLERCDLLVWLDLPTATVMRQVVRRTVARRLRREELWNGNVEPPLRTLLTDRDHIIRWAWRTRGKAAVRARQALAQRPDLVVVRLRSHDEADAWLAGPLAPGLAADA